MRPKASVIIPCRDDFDCLPKLLDSLVKQSKYINEILIVDSSSLDEAEKIISKYTNEFRKIIRIKIKSAYPGKARNIGLEKSESDLIAFIDCRTYADELWLKDYLKKLRDQKADFLHAKIKVEASTFFQKIVRASTYGRVEPRSLVGSVFQKKILKKTGVLNENIRAGEDLDWVKRVRELNIKKVNADTALVTYYGLPTSLLTALKKYYSYSMANSNINLFRQQRTAYLLILLSVPLILAYNWNTIFAAWNEESFWYVPNVTKIVISVILAGYFLFRALLRPILRKERIGFLLPFNWVLVGLFSLSVDLIKSPGSLKGLKITLFNNND